MGASFNRTSWYLKGGVVGTEIRAFNNMGWNRDAGGTKTEKIGLTGYVPRSRAARGWKQQAADVGHRQGGWLARWTPARGAAGRAVGLWCDAQLPVRRLTRATLTATPRAHLHCRYRPNINNPRDPRFGRLSELPSEDPYHAG